MAVFFTSDTHFGHAGALHLFKRPFASVAVMDATMVERWNGTVGEADVVWHLGDFAVGAPAARIALLMRALNGTKHLVTGNNDGEATTAESGWASVQAYAEIEVNGRPLVLCHYPFRTWRGMSKGAVNLHGHSHGRLAALARQCDVGVDAWDFRPVELKTLIEAGARSPAPPSLGPADEHEYVQKEACIPWSLGREHGD